MLAQGNGSAKVILGGGSENCCLPAQPSSVKKPRELVVNIVCIVTASSPHPMGHG
jgi:hypothetical protein